MRMARGNGIRLEQSIAHSKQSRPSRYNKNKAGADRFRSAPEMHIFPPKIPLGGCGPFIVFPPEFNVAERKSLAGQDMMRRLSVHSRGLSATVGLQVRVKLRIWKLN